MAKKTTQDEVSKADEILEVGQELIQTVGFDGFSYRDIADRVGIKSASVHYYFPAKTDLASAVARQYRTDFNAAVAKLDTDEHNPVDQLAGFAAIFQDTLEDLNRVCLAGMLASEADSVPDTVTVETTTFFSEQQAWIAQTVAKGIETGDIVASAEPDLFAQTFLSALEGAMIMARCMERPEHLRDVAQQLISLVSATSSTN